LSQYFRLGRADYILEKLKVSIIFSLAGYLPKVNGKEPAASELRAKFASSDSTLTVEELDALVENFIAAAEAGNHEELGWQNSTYSVSKVALSALSRIQQREFLKDSRKVKL